MKTMKLMLVLGLMTGMAMITGCSGGGDAGAGGQPDVPPGASTNRFEDDPQPVDTGETSSQQ